MRPDPFHTDAMKANFRSRLPISVTAAAMLAVTASCSDRIVPPPPTPAPRATPTPAPKSPPRPAVDWRDALITPGDWAWSMENGRSQARFAEGLFTLRCNRSANSVTLIRAGSAQGQIPVTVTTSEMTRALSGEALGGHNAGIAVTLQARDGLLDAMAFSRGRFAVETAGLPTLYIPSWPEVSRVIEDCR